MRRCGVHNVKTLNRTALGHFLNSIYVGGLNRMILFKDTLLPLDAKNRIGSPFNHLAVPWGETFQT